MSQSDYIYLDMQTTNVQMNSTTVTPGNLSFTTDLNTTIVPNDYYMSIDKFQVDTSSLPVLVVEPDLTSSPFVPNKTIHKVGIMTSGANLLLSGYYEPLNVVDTTFYPPTVTVQSDISASIDGSIIAVGYPYESVNNISNAGKVILYKSDRTPIVLLSPNPVSGENFGFSLSVSGNGKYIAIATSQYSGYIYIYNVVSNTFVGIPKDTYANTNTKVVMNNLGNRICVLYYNSNAGVIWRLVDGVWNAWHVFGGQFTSDTPICMNRAGTSILFGVKNYGYCIYIYYHEDNDEWYSIFYSGDHYSFGTRLDMKGPDDTILVSAPLESTYGVIYVLTPNVASEVLNLVIKRPRNATNFSDLGGIQLVMSEDTLQYYIVQLADSTYQVWKYNRITGNYLENITLPMTTSIKITTYGKDTDFGLSALVRADNYGSVNTIREKTYTVKTHFNLPSNLKDVPSITNVMWEQTISPPSRSVLNGINTIQFPYYHCNSYSKFIKVVNDAIASSYVANYNYLFDNWVSTLGTNTKNQFIDLVARSFPIPPFLEWDTTKSIAKMYVNQFFYGSTYLLPISLWDSDTDSSTRTVIKFPLDLKIVFNASLYSLFNTFPATPTIINGEQFYILEITNILNNVELSLISSFPTINRYSFLETYETDGVLTIPYLDSFEYPMSNLYIITEQEAPTTESWNPIYSFALVNPQDIFIKNQFKTLSLYGSSSTTKNDKTDFIIKIDGNYRPFFIYNKQIENSNVNLVGTTPITTLEMNVYYISKTGILVPFKLPRNGSASLRILFEKKRKLRS